MAKIGEIAEIPGETVFKWKIKDFFSLSDETNTLYESPKFYFSGASWKIHIYPNGETKEQSDDWISIYLVRSSSGSPVSVTCSFRIESVDGKTNLDKIFRTTFRGKSLRAGIPRIIERTVLVEKKSEIAPTNVLTIICTLENSEPIDIARSLYRRLQDVCDNLQEMYVKGKKTDFILKINKEGIPAHSIILETRSPVFAAMLSHDTKEKQTGEVDIEDIDKYTMHNLLLHMYSGDMNMLTTNEALSLYAAAEKYDLSNVKELCLEFINEALSVESVCDVIQFADLYQEEEVSRRAREYLREHAEEILESEKWKTFERENPGLSGEILRSLVKALLPKGKSSNK